MDELLRIASNYSGGASAGLADVRRRGRDHVAGRSPLDPRRAIGNTTTIRWRRSPWRFLNLDGKGGSYALASVQADTFVQSVQTVADGSATSPRPTSSRTSSM